MIYIASKTRHAGKWLSLKERGVPINSSWIHEAGPGQTASMRELWQRISDEVQDCKVLIVYLNRDDFPNGIYALHSVIPLKGALIEAGMALAYGKPVYVVLDGIELLEGSRPIGSWIYHPNVRTFPHMKPAIQVARRLCGGD